LTSAKSTVEKVTMVLQKAPAARRARIEE